ncbi:hypothetical protein JOF42_000371 [Microbacterium phyllosphaerae]|uniref:DUF4209 domain-containing protein n=1 Tax=Microbacterium phyllosphaerae TaxID=124798 RepID=A0ABS4WL07_9MICO|nr:DUF4209 domain-containing protein [Microbacterium phyllosphaerae]MBP2376876.1 hypothetical protein [Microbacterium phyllosphaerae]
MTDSRWSDAVAHAHAAGLLALTTHIDISDLSADLITVCEITDAVRNFVLRSEDRIEPYQALWAKTDPRPNALTSDQIQVLEAITRTTADAHLRVRALDLISLNSAGATRIAQTITMIDALSDAVTTADLDARLYGDIQRAFTVAKQFRAATDAAAARLDGAILTRLHRSENATEALNLGRLLRLARRAASDGAAIADTLIRVAHDPGAYIYTEEASQWLRISGDSNAADDRLIDVVESLRVEAEEFLRRPTPERVHHARHNVELAMDTLTRVPSGARDARGLSSLSADLNVLGRRAHRATVSLMRASTVALPDLRTVRASFLDAVSDQPGELAIAVFLHGVPLIDYEKFLVDATTRVHNRLIPFDVARVTIDPSGRIVNRSDHRNTEPVYDIPRNIWNAMMDAHTLHIVSVVNQLLAPQWAELSATQVIPLAEFVRSAHDSPLVPPHHDLMVAKALYYGFSGDFVTAAQLAAPEIEAIVRHHLGDAGAKTSVIGRTGMETENGLSSLVGHRMMVPVFTSDVAFAIRALFCGDGGANLRNDVAHGLLDEVTTSSARCFYAWWLLWRLVDAPFSNPELDHLAHENRVPAHPQTE